MRVEGNGTPLQYSCLENTMDGGALDTTKQLDFRFSLSCIGGVPGTAEPGGLPSMGSHRVGHD